MTVKEIMTKSPVTVDAQSTVRKAVERMGEKNVGSLVVVEGSKPKGLLTERDLLDKVIAVGKDAEATIVARVMSPATATVGPGASLKEAAETMTNRKSRLLVMEGDKLLGIVTGTDIVKGIRKQGRPFDISKTVSKNVMTVNADTPVADVVRLMSARRIGSLMVSRAGRPYGIFTERDLIKKVLVPRVSLERKVEEVATKKLITAHEGLDGKEAARIMAANSIKRLPLLKGDKVVGIVTARDIVEAYGTSS